MNIHHSPHRIRSHRPTRALAGVAAFLLAGGIAVPAHAVRPLSPSTPSSCSRADLAFGLGSPSAGLGHWGIPLQFRNISSGACTLVGYPTVEGQFVGGTADLARSTMRGYLVGVRRISTIELNPGSVASAFVEGSNVPTGPNPDCDHYAALGVALPGRANAVVLAADLAACAGLEVHPIVAGPTGTDY